SWYFHRMPNANARMASTNHLALNATASASALRSRRCWREPDRERATPPRRRGADEMVRPPAWLPRRFIRTLRRRGHGGGRRVWLRQDHVVAIAIGAGRTQRRANPLPHARRLDRRSLVDERVDATIPVPHRLGLCAPGPTARPAHGRVRRRQCR